MFVCGWGGCSFFFFPSSDTHSVRRKSRNLNRAVWRPGTHLALTSEPNISRAVKVIFEDTLDRAASHRSRISCLKMSKSPLRQCKNMQAVDVRIRNSSLIHRHHASLLVNPLHSKLRPPFSALRGLTTVPATNFHPSLFIPFHISPTLSLTRSPALIASSALSWPLPPSCCTSRSRCFFIRCLSA